MNTKALVISGVATLGVLVVGVAVLFLAPALSSSETSTPALAIERTPVVPSPAIEPTVQAEPSPVAPVTQEAEAEEQSKARKLKFISELVATMHQAELSDEHCLWASAFLDHGSRKDWKEATNEQRLAISLGLATHLHRDLDQNTLWGATSYYVTAIDLCLDTANGTPFELFETMASASRVEPKALEEVFAKEATRLKVVVSDAAARKAGRVILLNPLRKWLDDYTTVFDIRVTNKSTETVSVTLQVECKDENGDYKGIAEDVVFDLSPGNNVILQPRARGITQVASYEVRGKVISTTEPFAVDVAKPGLDEQATADQKLKQEKEAFFRNLEDGTE